MAARPATRLLEGLAPWIPIAMLVALVGIAFYLRAQELGTGIGAVAWLVVAVASGLAGTCGSRIRHQAAAGSWTMPRQWEIQRTWLNSARAAVRSPAKPNGV